jgi:hypothetical protein
LSLYVLFYKVFDHNNKKRWIPISMGMTEREIGMTDKIGTIHCASTLGKNKR